MRFIPAVLIFALAACDAPAPGAPQPSQGDAGWSIAADGDLNTLFDCLEDNNIALVAAHRGGPSPGFPENAIETFDRTLSIAPALLEIDVATSADGVLYLMHDDTLERTTTGEGPVESAAWREISALRLKDGRRETAYHPPSFADALSWAKGRTILEIDFKKTTRYEDVIAEIDRQQAEDRVILIAYTLAQAKRLHRLAPRVMISLSIEAQSDLNKAVAAGIPADRLLGFTGTDEPKPRLFSILNHQNVEVIFGTLGGRDSIDDQIAASGDDARYAEIAGMGVDIIATDRPEAAQKALDAAGHAPAPDECGVRRG